MFMVIFIIAVLFSASLFGLIYVVIEHRATATKEMATREQLRKTADIQIASQNEAHKNRLQDIMLREKHVISDTADVKQHVKRDASSDSAQLDLINLSRE